MSDRPSIDWNNAQQYLEGLLPEDIREPADQRATAGVPKHPTIGPAAAQLIEILILATKPKRVLEIGTSIGYSALAMGKALRAVGGRLITIEIEPRLAQTAAANISEAGLDDIVEVLIDDANTAVEQIPGTFGLILQDGNKDDYLRMLPRLVERLDAHGLLVTDDVLFPVMRLPDGARPFGYALSLYNHALQENPLLRTVWLPIGDGVAVSVRIG